MSDYPSPPPPGGQQAGGPPPPGGQQWGQAQQTQGQPWGQQPPYQPSAPQPSRTNGAAIAALILGIMSLFLFFIPVLGPLLGLVAIILGIVGIRAAKRRDGSGRGMAIGGLITGFLGLIVGVIIIALAAWVFTDPGFQEEFQQQLEELEIEA